MNLRQHGVLTTMTYLGVAMTSSSHPKLAARWTSQRVSLPDWTSCRECRGASGRNNFLLQRTPSTRVTPERLPAARAEVAGLKRLRHEVARLTSCREGLGAPGRADLLREHVRERGAEPIRYRGN
jgi:hypothetical protein